MKKAFTLIVLLIMVLTVFAGCQLSRDPNVLYDDPLSDEQKKEINYALVMQCDTKINWEYVDPWYGDACYGTINDCIIVRTPDPDPLMWRRGLLEIADFTFEWQSPFGLHVYRDGEACELSEAYEKGWLTKEQIGEIYEKHNSYYSEYLKQLEEEGEPFASDPDVLYDDPLSDEQKQEIDQALATQCNNVVSWSAFYSYYGTINDCIVVRGKSDEVNQPMRYVLTIADIAFEWNGPFKLYAYRDGEAFELSEAYEKGWLTQKQIERISTKHNKYYLEWLAAT